MSNKKKASVPNGFMPIFPGPTSLKPPALDAFDWDWSKGREESGKKANELKADFKSFWEKSIDLQKSTIDGTKDQYDQLFAYMTDMLDSFAEFLPDEMPLMPSWVQSPKSFRKSMKEWEEMVNEHFVEQMNSWTSFFIQSQEKACEQISTSEGAEETEESAEAKPTAAKEAKAAKASKATETAKSASKAKPAAKAKAATESKPARQAKTATPAKAASQAKVAKEPEPAKQAKAATPAKAAAGAKAAKEPEPAKQAKAATPAKAAEGAKDAAPAKDAK